MPLPRVVAVSVGQCFWEIMLFLAEKHRIKELERQVWELRQANKILKGKIAKDPLHGGRRPPRRCGRQSRIRRHGQGGWQGCR